MKKFFLLLFFICRVSFAETCDVTDDAGQTIRLNKPAMRIVSLAPDLTELLFAAGASDHVVGVMQGSDYPAAAKKIPIVGSYNSIDAEAILKLHPDLIIVWAEGFFPEKLKKIFSVPVYVSHQQKLSDIPHTLQRFGCLAGTEKKARAAANDFSTQLNQLREQNANKKIISVFYQVWSGPFITVTKNSWINEVISLCNGKNIFADLKGSSPEVSLEAIIANNPDVIMTAKTKQDVTHFWKQWPTLSAVKHNAFITVNADHIERAGPRLIEGAKEICDQLDKVRARAVVN